MLDMTDPRVAPKLAALTRSAVLMVEGDSIVTVAWIDRTGRYRDGYICICDGQSDIQTIRDLYRLIRGATMPRPLVEYITVLLYLELDILE